MIPFLRLSLTDDAEAVHAAIARVLERGWFVQATGSQAVASRARQRCHDAPGSSTKAYFAFSVIRTSSAWRVVPI